MSSINSTAKKEGVDFNELREISNSYVIPEQELKNRLSAFWIFIMINMAFADIVGFSYPGFMAKLVAGRPIDGVVVTPTLLMIGALLLEIPTSMIILSRFLKKKFNRLFNIIAAVITIIYVTGMSSPTVVYWFFCSLEIVASVMIIALAWKWRTTER